MPMTLEDLKTHYMIEPIKLADTDIAELHCLLQRKANWGGVSALALTMGGSMLLIQIILAFVSTQQRLFTLVAVSISIFLLVVSGLTYSRRCKVSEEVDDLIERITRQNPTRRLR